MFEEQRGECKICSIKLNKTRYVGDMAVVDHCHTTGKIRGILCNSCNRGIGYFRDNPKFLTNAASYLTGTELTPEGGSALAVHNQWIS